LQYIENLAVVCVDSQFVLFEVLAGVGASEICVTDWIQTGAGIISSWHLELETDKQVESA